MPVNVDFEISDAIANIVINGPEEHNRLSHEVLVELRRLVAELNVNRDVHVVTVTGAGDEYFSMGILTPQLKAALGKDRVLELVMMANDLFDAIERLPQIVIAGVNGAIRAGAVELVLACDIRLVADHARLSMPEAKWGGFPGAGAPVRLPTIVGRGRALELICTGREIDAAEMERLGLVEGVVPSANLRHSVMALAQQIASNGPLALRGAKRIVGTRMEPGFRAARELSDALRYALEWTEDADEGMAAHLEGRLPKFKGR